MKNYFFLILILLVVSSSSYGQKRKKGIMYKNDITALKNASEIIWYGVDFSKCKITDGSKMGEAKMMKEKYIPSWIGLMNQRYEPDWIGRKLKMNLKEDLNAIQQLYKSIDENQLVSFSTYSFPIDSVKSFVKSYQLAQNNGIGFVLMIENLNKPERYITGYFVFFDITSRELLCSTIMKGFPGSKYGFTQWWKEGMVELFDYYFRDYLRKCITD